MLTKLDYRMYNYRRLTTLLMMSLIHFCLFKTPFISNYNLNVLEQTDLKDSIITITVINSVLVLLETTVICLILNIIAQAMAGYRCSNSSVLSGELFYGYSISEDFCGYRLDLSNPFLYSAKCSALRE